jgi:hypothetical protein
MDMIGHVRGLVRSIGAACKSVVPELLVGHGVKNGVY